MKITMIGTGYVGLVTGACFAEMGNTVYNVDVDKAKIDDLNRGGSPIFEPGLDEMILRNMKGENLFFTTDIEEALRKTDVCFIAVGTPMGEDGGADLSYVLTAAKEIGRYMDHDMTVVDKSTVPVGTWALVAEAITGELAARGVDFTFKVVSNPEFLKEGSAVKDFMSPDRVVIGVPDKESEELMRELYSSFIRNSDRFIVMDVTSAEMTKYAANAMLATRISFMNEIAGICEAVGADVNMVRLGIGSDSRIGYSFLYAGCGYGGSCFPKDIRALIRTAKDCGCTAGILEQVEAVNRRQKGVLAEKVVRRFGEDLRGRKFAVWGLAFKPDTDDMREAPAVDAIQELLSRGAEVAVYDPAAMGVAKEHYLPEGGALTYAKSKYSALNDADAMLLVTEWKEFRSPDFGEMKLRMKSPVVFDGRNQYKAASMKRLGFEYSQIGATGA
ncbi:MAG: UDP-glucose/GDP-mannose dehydrogenase family protein [Clostridiales bacterium]|nr:UDP-glucose/GDP-mannose dehydrogenase family protein [Clostridiales bacterium]